MFGEFVERLFCDFVGEALVLLILLEKAMFPKSFRHAGRVENMDEYLQSLGLWRKVIPKDGASLYRVAAEQVSCNWYKISVCSSTV